MTEYNRMINYFEQRARRSLISAIVFAICAVASFAIALYWPKHRLSFALCGCVLLSCCAIYTIAAFSDFQYNNQLNRR